jgi:2-polyprenyl-3-methyl-5-hydroxy-6-metoxy-1,4-benzoquinol methylase
VAATDHTKRFYDLTAETVADEWYPNEVLMPTIREFVSRLPREPRVLDLGCGPGHESMRLASAGATVLGLDFSEESIRIARERCPQCRFEVADFFGLDARFGRFHGVFAAASLIHVPPARLPDVMARIAGVLEDEGLLLAIVLEGEGLRERWPVVKGRKLKRTLYLYRREDLAAATADLVSCGELPLADELVLEGWRAQLLGLRTSRTGSV